MEPSTISACLVVYNEEKLIERCLSSLVDLCDEIIVVHDGPCTDKTLEIAKRYTKDIYIEERVGIAEPHRAKSFECATSKWILQIDADEYLEDEAIQIIKKELSKQKTADAYALRWPIWNTQKYITAQWPHKPCLFRKQTMHFIAFPQNEVSVSGIVKFLDARLEHKPLRYNQSISSILTKQKKWIMIHADYMKRSLEGFRSFQPPHSNKWPLHMSLITKYGVWSLPLVFFVLTIGSIKQPGSYNTPYILFKQVLLICIYYTWLAIELRKVKQHHD